MARAKQKKARKKTRKLAPSKKKRITLDAFLKTTVPTNGRIKLPIPETFVRVFGLNPRKQPEQMDYMEARLYDSVFNALVGGVEKTLQRMRGRKMHQVLSYMNATMDSVSNANHRMQAAGRAVKTGRVGADEYYKSAMSFARHLAPYVGARSLLTHFFIDSFFPRWTKETKALVMQKIPQNMDVLKKPRYRTLYTKLRAEQRKVTVKTAEAKAAKKTVRKQAKRPEVQTAQATARGVEAKQTRAAMAATHKKARAEVLILAARFKELTGQALPRETRAGLNTRALASVTKMISWLNSTYGTRAGKITTNQRAQIIRKLSRL